MSYRMSYKEVQRIQQQRGVRDVLRKVAERKAQQVTMLATAEGARVTVIVSHGTRPKGRSYSRIAIPMVDEFGDSGTPRRRLLARVASAR